MGWRIKEVSIKDFKFFRDRFSIDFDGRHILLYGENGSGKSSIYWSLYTLFQACLKTQEDAQKYYKHGNNQNLRNRFCEKQDESSISITFIDDTRANTQEVEISNIKYPFSNPMVKSFMERSMMSSDFMNYKFLQKLFDFPNSKENEVFEIFEKEVFKFLLFSKSLIDLEGENRNVFDAESWWLYIKSVPDTLPRNSGKNGKTINMGTPRYKAFMKLISDFNQEMQKALFTLGINTERIIENEFENSVKIQIIYSPVTFNTLRPNSRRAHDGIIHPPRILLTAQMTNSRVVDSSPIVHPKSFFNEAKLTCAALAMRLAILGTKPTSGPDYASILLMDDLLISLDMGYRRRVIDSILKYRSGRQLIILTHDRNFFRLVENEIEKEKELKEWKMIELCIDEDHDIPAPKTIEYVDLLSKARSFYHRHEYAACANTLRRAYEGELKRIYPKKFIYDLKTDSLDYPCRNLNGLISYMGKFQCYYHGFPNLVPNLTNDRQLILNPFSHDDLDTPLFKRELKESIEQLETISRVTKSVIVDGERVHVGKYRMEIKNGEYLASADFLFLEIWDKISYAGIDYYGNPQVRVISQNGNFRTKDVMFLNCLHHAVANAVSLNESTAPIANDCITLI